MKRKQRNLYMKKLIAMLLALVMFFSLVACTGTRDPHNDAAWDAYMRDRQKLHPDEIYVGLGQASYDRSLAGTN